MYCRTIIVEGGFDNQRPIDLWCNVIEFRVARNHFGVFGGPISARPKSEMRITPSDPLFAMN
jgi:hypothetical protein